MPTCPSCGHAFTTPRKTKTHAVGPTAEFSDADVFRHYHETAPVEDLRFFLAHAVVSDALKADAEALLASTNGFTLPCGRPEWYRRLGALHQRWRAEHTRDERGAQWAAEIDQKAAAHKSLASRIIEYDVTGRRFAAHIARAERAA